MHILLAVVFESSETRNFCRTPYGVAAVLKTKVFVAGVYTVEPLLNPHWVTFSLGLMILYHFIVLQGIGLVSPLYLSLSITVKHKMFALHLIFEVLDFKNFATFLFRGFERCHC